MYAHNTHSTYACTHDIARMHTDRTHVHITHICEDGISGHPCSVPIKKLKRELGIELIRKVLDSSLQQKQKESPRSSHTLSLPFCLQLTQRRMQWSGSLAWRSYTRKQWVHLLPPWLRGTPSLFSSFFVLWPQKGKKWDIQSSSSSVPCMQQYQIVAEDSPVFQIGVFLPSG